MSLSGALRRCCCSGEESDEASGFSPRLVPLLVVKARAPEGLRPSAIREPLSEGSEPTPLRWEGEAAPERGVCAGKLGSDTEVESDFSEIVVGTRRGGAVFSSNCCMKKSASVNTLWGSAGGGAGVSLETGVDCENGDMGLSGTGGTVFEGLRISDLEGGDEKD